MMETPQRCVFSKERSHGHSAAVLVTVSNCGKALNGRDVLNVAIVASACLTSPLG
jgi:hypothetical protein